MGEAPEPKLKGFYAAAAREAATWAWGPGGLKEIARRMPEREREELFAEILPPWIPERTLIEMGYAMWDGPAGHSRQNFFRFLHKNVELGFGRIRKMLLSVTTPEKIISMADELWKSDHTHGSWEVHVAPRRARMILTGHPYADTPHARTTLAEQVRYIVHLTRAQNVTASYGVASPGAMEITLRWK